MKIRLLVPCLVILLGVSGCIPVLRGQQAILAVLTFVLNPTTDVFNCFPIGDFVAEFDLVFREVTSGSGSIELGQRSQPSTQLVFGNAKWFVGNTSPVVTYSLSGSGTHGTTPYTETYDGTIEGRSMMGRYQLMEEGCGTVEWSYTGELSSELPVSSAEESSP